MQSICIDENLQNNFSSLSRTQTLSAAWKNLSASKKDIYKMKYMFFHRQNYVLPVELNVSFEFHIKFDLLKTSIKQRSNFYFIRYYTENFEYRGMKGNNMNL